MAKIKVTKTTPNTEGFYNEEFSYAPNAVLFPDKTSLLKENKDEYNYPVNGWTWFDSIEEAYASQGKTPPEAPTPRKLKN